MSRSTSTRTAADTLATREMLKRELEALENQISGLSEELERCKADRGRVQTLLKSIEANIIESGSEPSTPV